MFSGSEVSRMRKRLFQIIEVADENDIASKFYDVSMMICIVLSLVPIALKSTQGVLGYLDSGTAYIFILDYILRLITADYQLEKGNASFIKYPFTPMAIIDLLAILPSIVSISSVFRILKVFRLLRTLRVFRAFKFLRYSKSISLIINVFKREKESLLTVCGLAIGYVLISALIIICVEPDTFETYFDALYWATISLTTVGYGDLYATSTIGQIITMISSFFGIAIVALPAGIVTAGYIEEVNNLKKE